MTNTKTSSAKELESVETKSAISNETVSQSSASMKQDNKLCFDLNQIKCFFPSSKQRSNFRDEGPKKCRREPSETKRTQSVRTPLGKSQTKSNSKSSLARDDSSKSSRSRSKCPLIGSDRERSIEKKEMMQAKNTVTKSTAEAPQRHETPVNIEGIINKNEFSNNVDCRFFKNPEGAADTEKYKSLSSFRPVRIGPESLRFPVQKINTNRFESSFRMIKPNIKDNPASRGVNINSNQQDEFNTTATPEYELNVSKIAQHNSFLEDQRDSITPPPGQQLKKEDDLPAEIFAGPNMGQEFNPFVGGVINNTCFITSFDGRRNTLPQTNTVPGRTMNHGLKFTGQTYYGPNEIQNYSQGLFVQNSNNPSNIPNTSYLSTESTHEGSDHYYNITPSTSGNRLNTSLLSGLNSAKQESNGSGRLDTSWNGEYPMPRGNLRNMGPGISRHNMYPRSGKLNHSFNEKLLPSHYKVNSPAPSHEMNPNMNYNQFLHQILPQDESQTYPHYQSNIVTNQFNTGYELSQQARMQVKILNNNQPFMGTPITSRTATKNVIIPESDLENVKKDPKSPLVRNSGTNKRKKAEPQGNTTLFEINLNKIDLDGRTTLMIKNIPNKYNIDLLMETINKNHVKKFDFLYLPIDFKNKCNVGYAFINFLDTKYIEPFFLEFNGKRWEKFNSEKICSIKYARIQGRDALIQHFEYSSVMNQHDKKLRPVIVSNIDVHKFGELINKQRNKL